MRRTTKEYAEILKAVLKMQIEYIEDDSMYDDSELLQGRVEGLLIALEKIDASEFLFLVEPTE